MKVWLDDKRPAPEDWVHVTTQHEAIELLKGGEVEEISLDADLGGGGGTGFGVANWMLEAVKEGKLKALVCQSHSSSIYSRQGINEILEEAKNIWAAD